MEGSVDLALQSYAHLGNSSRQSEAANSFYLKPLYARRCSTFLATVYENTFARGSTLARVTR